MRIFNEVLPNDKGELAMIFSEEDVKHLLLDLESQSKHHRSKTLEFKKIMRIFLENCERTRLNKLEKEK